MEVTENRTEEKEAWDEDATKKKTLENTAITGTTIATRAPGTVVTGSTLGGRTTTRGAGADLEFEDMFASCGPDVDWDQSYARDYDTHTTHGEGDEDADSSDMDLYCSSVRLSSSTSEERPPKSQSIAIDSSSSHIICSCYEDSKVYSQSAPHSLQQNYLDNMSKMRDRRDSKSGRYSIIGNSPDLKRRGSFINYLGRSVSKLKNMFSIS